MVVMMPVIKSTMARTQNKPVQEVKSTWRHTHTHTHTLQSETDFCDHQDDEY